MTLAYYTKDDHKIAYFYAPVANKPCVLFLPGYYSDMSGTKAVYLRDLCLQENLGFLSLDYRGHGKSSGNFIDFTLSDWLQDCIDIIQHVQAKNLIIVGSSMGGWLMLLLEQRLSHLVKGLIGIAAAPDFTEDLIWPSLSESLRQTLKTNGHLIMPSDYNPNGTPLSFKFLNDARQHLILRQESIECRVPIRLMHGLRDDDVPYHYAEKIINKVTSTDAWALFIKEGDHRLNESPYLQQLGKFVIDLCSR